MNPLIALYISIQKSHINIVVSSNSKIVAMFVVMYYNKVVPRGVAQMGARVVWDHEVAGSIPVTPTIKNRVK